MNDYSFSIFFAKNLNVLTSLIREEVSAQQVYIYQSYDPYIGTLTVMRKTIKKLVLKPTEERVLKHEKSNT